MVLGVTNWLIVPGSIPTTLVLLALELAVVINKLDMMFSFSFSFLFVFLVFFLLEFDSIDYSTFPLSRPFVKMMGFTKKVIDEDKLVSSPDSLAGPA